MMIECLEGVVNRLSQCSIGTFVIRELILITRKADVPVGKSNAWNRPRTLDNRVMAASGVAKPLIIVTNG